MSSHVVYARKSHSGAKSRSDVDLEVNVEHLSHVVDSTSLRDVPLAERRREAQKPLYLVRYE
jgi:hypothetical protein